MLSTLITAMLLLEDPKSDKKLVFSQDFRHLKDVDESVWHYNDGPVYNNEIQKYTKKSAKNAWVEGGRLIIEARKHDGVVTSGRLQSVQSFKYGYFEAKVKVPAGRGTWPAFWMLNDKLRRQGAEHIPWPRCGEIDIMEYVGYDPGNYHFTIHTEKYNHMKNTQKGKMVSTNEKSPQWRTFGVDWTTDYLRFYMDGNKVYEIVKDETSFDAWPFDDPYYMILNLAIGGGWGGAKGVDDAIFPSRYEVEYVKVYQK